MNPTFFPDRYSGSPRIYAYSDSHDQYQGLLKIGYTTQTVEERVKQQYPTLSSSFRSPLSTASAAINGTL